MADDRLDMARGDLRITPSVIGFNCETMIIVALAQVSCASNQYARKIDYFYNKEGQQTVGQFMGGHLLSSMWGVSIDIMWPSTVPVPAYSAHPGFGIMSRSDNHFTY